MARTYEEIESAALKQAADAVNKQYGVRKSSDEEQIGQINAAIDREAGAATKGYQDRINGAAEEFQPLYDRNALQEMISRRQVEESMANMGLTDSGLNRTQQTAIALQRGNADTTTRKQQQDYVTKAQEAIDSIMASAASQKAQQEAAIRKASADWYTGAMASADQSARTSAATQYQAEQDYAAKIEAANIEARAKALEAQQKAVSDNSAARAKYAQALITSGMSEDQAWASAYARYGTGDEKNDAYYSAYNRALNAGYSTGAAQAAAEAARNGQDPDDAVQAYTISRAQSVVGNNDLLKDGKAGYEIVAALFKGGKDNAKYTVEKLQPVVAKMKGYDQLSDEEKTIALAIASGNVIRTRWGDESASFKQKLATGLGDKFSGVALEAALRAAGIQA